MQLPIKERRILDISDSEFPPGPWACAGRNGDQYGVFTGASQEIENFIPESRIAEFVAVLMSRGDDDLANILESAGVDLLALDTECRKLLRDLAGRRI
jgi:hypothetical protein